MPQPHLKSCRFPQSLTLASAGTQRRGDRVFLIVLRRKLFYFTVCHLLDATHEISQAITIYRIAQLDLGIDFISFGDSDVPHVVAEARDFQALSIVPRARSSSPDTDLGVNFSRTRPRFCAPGAYERR